MPPCERVVADLRMLRQALRADDARFRSIRRRSLPRVALDLLLDWTLVVLAVAAVHVAGAVALLPALVLIGNRQRALGNLLHDAAHRNLSDSLRLNDALARLFVAPALFADLQRYRIDHERHHAALGHPEHDPDLIPSDASGSPRWAATCAALLFDRKVWLGSLFNQLAAGLPAVAVVHITLWWAVVLAALVLLCRPDIAGTTLALWLAARATTFHVITTFREMCDHFGLVAGGVFSFTRDICSPGLMRWLVHPHNNGLHLTHHLMPSVPYHRLPEAHRLFREHAEYRRHGNECFSYFRGGAAVVRPRQVLREAA